jgi:hypothetical protein
MVSLAEDVQRAVQATKAWRAQWLCNEAGRLDVHIEKLKARAAEYRAQAARINPTSSDQ